MERGRPRGRGRGGKANRGGATGNSPAKRGSQSMTSLAPLTREDRPRFPTRPPAPEPWFQGGRYPSPPPAYDDLDRRARHLAIDEYGYRSLYGPPPPSYGFQQPPMPYHPGPDPGFDGMKIPAYRYSYEEKGGRSNQGESREQSHDASKAKQNQRNQSPLRIESLVKALTQMKGYWSNSTTLGRLVEHPSKAVVKLAKKNPDIFGYLNSDNDTDYLVELKPKLLVCEQYVQTSGCKDPAACFYLHMCKFFAIGTCRRAPCNYGHGWKTDHNMKVLKKFHLQEINDDLVLGELAKKSAQGSLVPRICSFYNGSGCSRGDMECNALHICHAYVYSNRLCKATCLLGHDIFARHCVKLLNKYGISTNEAARDIFQKLDPGPPPVPKRAKTQEKPAGGGSRVQRKPRSKVPDETSESIETSSTSETSSSSDDSSEDEDDNSKKPPRKNRRGKKPQNVSHRVDKEKGDKGRGGNKNKDDKRKVKDSGKSEFKDKGETKTPTLYSYNLCGDVAIPEICSYSLNGKCFNEKKGCPRLHSKSQVQWQVQVNSSWYNLRAFQGKVLETAYRDVNQDEVTLPSPDPSKVDKDTKDLVGLLGTSNLKVDFQEMTMKGDSNVSWAVRRLTSFSKTGDVLFFQWFFYDDQKWIKYGAVDSKGRTDLVSEITSDEIERVYLKDDNQALQFKNQKFTYEINFGRMTQKNLQTKTERPIRRRPLIQRNISMKGSSDNDIPTNWEKMSESETYKRVPVTSSEERMSVLKMFRLTLPTAEVVSIERVQSPFLLKAFVNKKKELSLKYSEEEINIQQLFHGTKAECVEDICKENFDWRLYGSSHGHAFGRGTYFSNSAATSCGYCSADQNNEKILFIAQVIIGKVTVGNSSLTRPPTGFDTTVNSTSAPNTFVKYDKQEYYPEYILKLKT